MHTKYITKTRAQTWTDAETDGCTHDTRATWKYNASDTGY